MKVLAETIAYLIPCPTIFRGGQKFFNQQAHLSEPVSIAC